MKVSEWLANIGSHEIYDRNVLNDIPEPVFFDKSTDRLIDTQKGTTVYLGSRFAVAMRNNEGALETGNPKGAYLDSGIDDNERLFGGYELSGKLDKLLTGENAGAKFFGRGFAHRASIKHLAEKGY